MGRNANKCPDNIAKKYPRKSARMFLSKLLVRNARMFLSKLPVRNARMFPSKLHDRNANRWQKKFAIRCPNKHVEISPGRSAERCPDRAAKTLPRRSAHLSTFAKYVNSPLISAGNKDDRAFYITNSQTFFPNILRCYSKSTSSTSRLNVLIFSTKIAKASNHNMEMLAKYKFKLMEKIIIMVFCFYSYAFV